MTVFTVIDETPFYHPDFFANLIRRSKDEFIGVALVVDIPKKNNVNEYLKKHWHCLRFSEMATLAWRKYTMLLKDKFSSVDKDGSFYSVESVCKAFDIPYFKVSKSINKKEYLDQIEEKAPDVILSSNSLIFKDKLLSLPKRACINRHSSLLPSYGGVWPVLRSYAEGEEEFGVSVHQMQPEIDTGPVLSQKKIEYQKDFSVADIYERCFQISVDAVLEALDKVRQGDFNNVSDRKASYYSFPTPEDWKRFRQRGGRFV